MKKIFFASVIVFILNNGSHAQNVVNGDFEQSTSGWTRWSSSGAIGLIGTAQFFYSSEITPAVQPLSGQYMARLGGFGYEQNYIKQTITLPNTPNVYLGLNYQTRASTTSECAGLWVGAEIRIYIAGQLLLDQYLCNYNAVNVWTFGYFDLTAARGQAIEILFRADAANSVWSYIYFDDVNVFTSLTGLENSLLLPEAVKLNQNYPNPFNPTTKIKYELSKACNVNLRVYSMIGEEVAILVNEEKQAGYYEVEFVGDNLSPGIYFYELNAGSFKSIRKMILIK